MGQGEERDGEDEIGSADAIMNDNQLPAVQAKAATAKEVVDRLVELANGVEPDQWMKNFLTVQSALAGGRFKEAIREEARMASSWTNAQWVVSRELAKTLESAMGILARQLHFPNHSEPVLELGELPNDVTALGTVAEERERLHRAFMDSFRRDPLEEDPRYADILSAASERADRELAAHPMKGGIGFCHVFWKRKQAILRDEYGLTWQTPAERNPGWNFD